MQTQRPTQTTASEPQRAIRPVGRSRLFGVTTIVAPLLVLASSIAWTADAIEARGVLQFYGAALSIFYVLALTDITSDRMPRMSTTLAVLGVLGMAAGVGFSIDYLHEVISGAESLADGDSIAGAFAPTLPGLLGPIAVIGIGVALYRIGLRPRWVGPCLVVAGLLFPISRIGEIPILAVADDLLFCIVLVPIGWALARGRDLSTA